MSPPVATAVAEPLSATENAVVDHLLPLNNVTLEYKTVPKHLREQRYANIQPIEEIAEFFGKGSEVVDYLKNSARPIQGDLQTFLASLPDGHFRLSIVQPGQFIDINGDSTVYMLSESSGRAAEVRNARHMRQQYNLGPGEIPSERMAAGNEVRLFIESIEKSVADVVKNNLQNTAAGPRTVPDKNLTVGKVALGAADILFNGTRATPGRRRNRDSELKFDVIDGGKTKIANKQLTPDQQNELLTVINKLHAAEQDPLKKLRLAELGGKLVTGKLTLQNLREDATLQDQPLLRDKVGNFEKSSLLDDAIERLAAKAALDPAYAEALALLKAAALAATAAEDVPQLLVDLAVELENTSAIELPARQALLQEQLRDIAAAGTADTHRAHLNVLTPANPDQPVEVEAVDAETHIAASLQARLDDALANNLDPKALANILLAVQQAAQLGVVQELDLSGLHTALSEHDTAVSLLPTTLADGSLSSITPGALAALLKDVSNDAANAGVSAALLQQIDVMANSLRGFDDPQAVPQTARATAPTVDVALQTELRTLAQDAGLALSPADVAGAMTAQRAAELVTALQDNPALADNIAFKKLAQQIVQAQTQPANENAASQAARENASLTANDVASPAANENKVGRIVTQIGELQPVDHMPSIGMATVAKNLEAAQNAPAVPVKNDLDLGSILNKTSGLTSAEIMLLQQSLSNTQARNLLEKYGLLAREGSNLALAVNAQEIVSAVKPDTSDAMRALADGTMTADQVVKTLLTKGSLTAAERKYLIDSGALKEDVTPQPKTVIVNAEREKKPQLRTQNDANQSTLVINNVTNNNAQSAQAQQSANDVQQGQLTNYNAPVVDRVSEATPSNFNDPRYVDIYNQRNLTPEQKSACGKNCKTCNEPCGFKDAMASEERAQKIAAVSEQVVPVANEAPNPFQTRPDEDRVISSHPTAETAFKEVPPQIEKTFRDYNIPENLWGTISEEMRLAGQSYHALNGYTGDPKKCRVMGPIIAAAEERERQAAEQRAQSGANLDPAKQARLAELQAQRDAELRANQNQVPAAAPTGRGGRGQQLPQPGTGG